MKILLLMSLLMTWVFAVIGEVTVVKGDAIIKRQAKNVKAKKKMPLMQSDVAVTKDGRLQMLFIDNTVISIGKNSLFKIEEYFYDESAKKALAVFELKYGYAKAITGRIGKVTPHGFMMKTPSTVIEPHGTVWSVNVGHTKEFYKVEEGSITLTFNDGRERTVTMASGETMTLYINAGNPSNVIKSVKGKEASSLKGDNRRIPTRGNSADRPVRPDRPTRPDHPTHPEAPTKPDLPDVVPG